MERDDSQASKGFMSVPDAARFWGKSTRTIHRCINDGRFPGAKKLDPDGPWSIPVEEVERPLPGNTAEYLVSIVRLRRYLGSGLVATCETEEEVALIRTLMPNVMIRVLENGGR